MPQCIAGTPWTITWICAGEAPDDSASAFVIASMIFGTDSSVTRVSYTFTSTHGISASSFVPRLGVAAPSVRVVTLDDHPGVLLQLGRLEHLKQGLRHPFDQTGLELGVQAPLEQLDPHEWHRPNLPCEVPAVHGDNRAGDVARGRRDEPGDRLRNLLRPGPTTHRDAGDDLGPPLGRQVGGHLRLDPARRDGVHADPPG